MPLPGEWSAEGWESPDCQLCLASEAWLLCALLAHGGGTGQAAPSQRGQRGRGAERPTGGAPVGLCRCSGPFPWAPQLAPCQALQIPGARAPTQGGQR